MTSTPAILASTLLDLAAKQEAAERRIKQELLGAVDRGDLARVREIVTRWLNGPVSAVLGQPQPTSPLAASPLGPPRTKGRGGGPKSRKRQNLTSSGRNGLDEHAGSR